MKANEFSLLGTELGLTAYGPNYCGLVYGWPLMLHNTHFTHVQVYVDRKKDRGVMKQLEEMLKTWGGAVYGWTGNVLTLTAGRKKKMRGSKAEYIGFCTYALNRVGLRPLDHCPYCGARFCDTAAMTTKAYRLTHYRCLRTAADEAQGKAADTQHSGSYLLGFLGALLGMIIGTIPTVLTIYFMSMEYSLFFALIPICIYLGYKLFGGRMDKSALVISVVLSVLAVFLLNYELFVVTLMVEYGASFGEIMHIIPELLADGSLWIDLIAESVQEFLFTALGIWVAWRFISVTDTGKANEAAASVQLAQPYRWDEYFPDMKGSAESKC